MNFENKGDKKYGYNFNFRKNLFPSNQTLINTL